MSSLVSTPRSDAVADAVPAADRKTAHLVRNVKLVMLSYLIDGTVLLLFHLAGTISWVPVLAYTGAGLAGCALVAWVISSGFTRRFKDPGIAIPFTALVQVTQLAAMLLIPELSFMFLLILFIVYVTLTMAVDVRRSLVAWALVSLGTAAVLKLGDVPVRIPNANLAEQLIAYGFFALTLWRCVWVGSVNRGMTELLHKRGRELAALTAQVDQLAHADELTGLLNRRSLIDALRDELQRAERSRAPLCVAILDLDRFKAVNDTLGHLAGDKTLKLFASTLQRHTRRADRFGRYGGEEFLLIMSGTPLAIAQVPIERMREALAAVDWREVSPDLKVTFSCGLACHQPGERIEELLQRADEALYRAKADGRNCTRVA